MPLLNNKRVPLVSPPPYDPRRKRKEVWYLRFTNEIFTNYESYVNRLMLYRQPVWTCEATGRQNLTYEQALESEGQDEQNRAEFRFCETLRRRMLQRIQFQTVRLEPLVDDIYNHFRYNFAPNEIVHCQLGENIYLAKILDVYAGSDHGLFPLSTKVHEKHENNDHSSSSEETESENDDVPRQPNGRLRFPDAFLHPVPTSPLATSSRNNHLSQQTSTQHRDMNGYTASGVHIIHDRPPATNLSLRYRVQLINEYEEPIEECTRIVQFQEIRRDKRVFSRNIIQRLIRECAHKDSYIGAPWLVKYIVAQRYGIDTRLPRHLQEAQDLAYASIARKRKAEEEKEIEKKIRSDEAVVQKIQIKEERFRLERRKQIPVKYPMEDLDLPIYRKDPNTNWALIDMSPDVYTGPHVIPYPSGGRPIRPIPHKNPAIPDDLFETFIAVYVFLTVFSEPLDLAPFSIDEFQQALTANGSQQQQTLKSTLIDSNVCLLNIVINERNHDGVSEIATGLAMEDYVDSLSEEQQNGSSNKASSQQYRHHDTAFTRLRRGKVERGWRDAEQLKLSKDWDNKEIGEDRKGWETVLVGCLNDVATPNLVPDLDLILRHLVPRNNSTASERERQYPTLSLKHKLAILKFLVEAANESTAIKDYMEQCQEQLTEFRRQKVELNKEGKSINARRAELDRRDRTEKEEKDSAEDDDGESGSSDDGEGSEDGSHDSDADDDSEQTADSDSEEHTRRSHERRHRSRQEKLKQKQERRKELEALRKLQYQKQREAAKARSQELRQKAEERRKLEEDERALRKKEDQLEKDMRKYSTLRIRPLGRDRFYNRYLYLDNVGTSETYGTGRLFVQCPSHIDIQMMLERENIGRLDEQPPPWGRGGGRWFILELMRAHGFQEESDWLEQKFSKAQDDCLSESWWRYYSEPEEVNGFRL
ncbi:ATP-utilizing chromatin assembly and remodelling N-terminal-domain-containing protein [Dichotomocladium elegans]|nr:ATP-utilizing chromatin assembly and remodelling N-terminal-domain-containing protein [Dichotomocladium elegans]